MLRTILRKELLENIHSYRFPLFALICVVLIHWACRSTMPSTPSG